MQYGIQTYSIRDEMQKDPENALRTLAGLGYQMLEFCAMNFDGWNIKKARQLKSAMDKYGLTATGSHIGRGDLEEHFEDMIACLDIVGANQVILAGADHSSQAKIDEMLPVFRACGEKLEARGRMLGFHNHADPFYPVEGGKSFMCRWVDETILPLEIDTYWAYAAGEDPVCWMKKLHKAGRLMSIHIKDGDIKGNGTPLLMGTAPVRDVYKAACEMGVPIIVESETQNPDGPTEAKICIEALRSMEK